jgi:hypothetical protein
VDGAVEDGPHDGVEPVGRQLLGEGQEVAGGVVDEAVDVPEAPGGAGDQGLAGGGLADVGGEDFDRSALARRSRDLARSRLELLAAAAGDRHAGPVRREGLRHREAEAGAAASDDDRAVREKRRLEHRAASVGADDTPTPAT